MDICSILSENLIEYMIYTEAEGGNLSPKDRQRHTVAGRLQLMELWVGAIFYKYFVKNLEIK